MNGKISIRLGAEDHASSVLRSMVKSIGDFANSTVEATHKAVEAFRARAMAVRDCLLQESEAFERARKSALSHYETLDQLNARIDAPKRAAAALERYNRILEETRRRQEALYAKKHYYNAFDPSTYGNLEKLHARQKGGSAVEGVDAGVMGLARSAKRTIPMLIMLNRAMSESSGSAGKVAQAMSSIVGLSMAFGKMGAAIGAVQAAVQLACNHFIESADKMLEAVKKRRAAVSANLERKLGNLEKSQQGAIAFANQKVAEATEKAADEAWERIATTNAGNKMSDALADLELAKMRNQKSADLMEASSGDAGRLSAAWDYKIAEREAALVKERMDREREAEEERLAVAQDQLDVTRKNAAILEAAAGEAGRIYNLAEQSGADNGRVKTLKAAFETAAAKAKAERDRAKKQEQSLDEADAEFDANEIKRENSQRDANDKMIEAWQRYLREEERVEREIEQKRADAEKKILKMRMDAIRKEIDEQKKSAGQRRTVADAAKSEFDRAFAMYRDPSRAAAEIGEEKAYQKDLDRLHRDARRYGGKWRIDELSRLMSAGDTQGVTTTLNEWRKSKSFTPEVEAMVRASAAEKTKTSAEDELRKIEKNTSGLAAKLDELLRMKE